MERYKEEENLEPWKKKVMEIHEKSGFLFYFDDFLDDNTDDMTWLVKGQLVKGALSQGSCLYLYTGEGKLLGHGILFSEPEEKEQGRKGLLKRRRNEFEMKIEEYQGENAGEASLKEKRRIFRNLSQNLSLISDIRC